MSATPDPLIGMPAPDFCLPDADGKTVCLHDLAGQWVVIYFYPRDNTPGCTLEAQLFTAALDDFAALNATVIGISGDSPGSHAKFAAKHALRHRLLSDEGKTVLAEYSVWKEKNLYGRVMLGIERSTFLVDPAGVVRAAWRRVKVPGHPDAVRATLVALHSASS
ncbi:MAG TPA: peroxiredoxin [Methanoregulaceae archaeon]|nr:peroxiredoxin [Methanoregulaceae archaeon]HQJ87873.1 peroxiredoxin [Methanoregulaceae archaeon]